MLDVDLGALAANWRTLRDRHGPGRDTAGVLKADGYGLGALEVAACLHAAGCRHFFTAHLPEAIEIRPLVPDSMLCVLHGLGPGEAETFLAHDIAPALGTLGEVEAWNAAGAARGQRRGAERHRDRARTPEEEEPGDERDDHRQRVKRNAVRRRLGSPAEISRSWCCAGEPSRRHEPRRQGKQRLVRLHAAAGVELDGLGQQGERPGGAAPAACPVYCIAIKNEVLSRARKIVDDDAMVVLAMSWVSRIDLRTVKARKKGPASSCRRRAAPIRRGNRGE